MLTVKYTDKLVQDRLSEIIGHAKNMRPAFLEIGEDLVESTKQRFPKTVSPSGVRWEENSLTTITQYLSKTSGNFKKDGSLTKKGEKRSANKKPLTGETRTLASTINYRLKGAAGVAIGSPKVQAAMMQYGGTKAKFPHLWGDIPARPFLGVSTKDRTNILEITSRYLIS